MDAPPSKENVRSFLKVRDLLARGGLKVPEIKFADITRGFLLISDLGVNTYLDIINENNADKLFKTAITALVQLQTLSAKNSLPSYSKRLLLQELDLFDKWYLTKHLGLKLGFKLKSQITDLKEILVDNALSQPQVIVHRDFMPRNLLRFNGDVGIIDFQDALIGPISYDLASLLKDAFISWHSEDINGWINYYLEKAEASNLPVNRNFRKWFDLMAVQRHLKVIGIFSRIKYRDKNNSYFQDIPRFFKYLMQSCDKYEELRELQNLLRLLQHEESRKKT